MKTGSKEWPLPAQRGVNVKLYVNDTLQWSKMVQLEPKHTVADTAPPVRQLISGIRQ